MNYQPSRDPKTARWLKGSRYSPDKGHMARILVIDDDPAITHLLRLLLEGDGHEVVVASDGGRGFALAQRERPDLVILDVMMRVMSGIAVLRSLANDPHTAGVPVVMVSSLDEDDLGGVPNDIEVAAYVRKPFKATDLLATVSSLTRPAAVAT
jgi:DNA-binding response OmpR family regulator